MVSTSTQHPEGIEALMVADGAMLDAFDAAIDESIRGKEHGLVIHDGPVPRKMYYTNLGESDKIQDES